MGVEKAAGYEIYGLGSDEVFVVWKYDITSLYNLLYLGCAFSFIVATLVAVLHHKGNVLRDIVAVRKCKDLHEREEYAFYLNIIVFLISIYCHTVEASNLDDLYIASRGIKLNAGMYVDWTITCPILQLIFVILAGPKATVSTASHLAVTALMIITGAIGVFIEDSDRRFTAFLLGCIFMAVMTRNMNTMIVESSGNTANLLCGSHYLTKLGQTTVLTWLTFPIMWLCSDMGYNWVPGMKYAFPVMNVVSKLTFKLVFTSYLSDELHMRHLGVRRRSNISHDSKDLESAVHDLAMLHKKETCEVATQTEPSDALMLSDIPIESKIMSDLNTLRQELAELKFNMKTNADGAGATGLKPAALTPLRPSSSFVCFSAPGA